MKKVLILCYYFPPCNGAPAWRPYSWAMNFKANGLDPLLMSRHWDGSENTWDDYVLPCDKAPLLEKHQEYDILFLPSKSYRINQLLTQHRWARKIAGNLYYFGMAISGRFNPEVDACLAFREHVVEQLKKETYDAVLISSPPSNILRLISVVRKHSDAVVIADIRDLWNNMLLTNNYAPSFKQKIWDTLNRIYYKKWLKHVDLITVIVEPFCDIVSTLSKQPIKVVYNGYESTLFSKLKKQRTDKFLISIIGNIYPGQDMSILLGGLNLFIQNKSADDINIRFIGAGAIPSVAANIHASIPSEFLTLSGRISKQEALQETLNADVLSFSGWKNVRGMISTKAFDYIASGNYVLIAPGDGDALDRLVAECNCGSSVNNIEDYCSTLETLFNEWKTNGELLLKPNKDIIAFYSRENQARIMAELIHETIDKKKV